MNIAHSTSRTFVYYNFHMFYIQEDKIKAIIFA